MISKFWSKWVWHWGLVGFLTLTEGLYNPHPIVAQVIPDNTLGAENSLLIKLNELNDRINGGAIRGSNLFHSFREFNVGEGRGVYFANPVGIENILSRVTGGNPSNILGRLGVLGGANLFLMNPNGILFGPNASLDIKGSFVATTADGIQLGERGFFSATEPQKSHLLSVSPGTLFFNQVANHPGNIINRGNLAVGKNLTLSANNLDLQGQLYAGGNLTLKALDMLRIRDSVTSPFVAAARGNLLIQGNQTIDIFALNHPQSGLFSGRDMILRSANTIGGDAHYWSGSNFRIEKLDGNLGGLYSPYDPIIRSLGDVNFADYTGASLHILAAGKVEIPGLIRIISPDPANGLVESVMLSNGNSILIDGKSEPTLDIRAGIDPLFINSSEIIGSGSFTSPIPTLINLSTSSDIKIGEVRFVDSNSSLLQISGKIFLTNQYRPNSLAGNIIIGEQDFSSVVVSSFHNGGSVIIDSKNSIILNGNILASARQNPMTETLGNGGSIRLLAQGDITLSPSAIIRANGQAGGNITLNAQGNIKLEPNVMIQSTGVIGGAITLYSGANIEGSKGTIATESGVHPANTQGGNIKITANSLSLTETIIKTTDGSTEFGFAEGDTNLTGKNSQGGDINISVQTLSLTNGAQLNTSTFKGGNAGNITIQNVNNDTNKASLDGAFGDRASGIFSKVESGAQGNGGLITINTQILSLTNGAQIDTSTLGKGNAGNVTINASESVNLEGNNPSSILSRVDSSVQGSNLILAEGNGGKITINTPSLSLKNGAQINANTEGVGNAGEIIINASNSVFLEGIGVANNPTGIFGIVSFFTPNGKLILAEGDGGDITINTPSLTLTNGAQINVNTSGQGNAGTIFVKNADHVTLDNSTISSAVNQIGIGQGGNIDLQTRSLSLTNNSNITASTTGTGDAGDITLNTPQIFLTDDKSVISASTSTDRQGGSINIIAPQTLDIRGIGQITVETTGSGNAGNINLNANQQITITQANINAFTTAEGNAGSIIINTPQLNITDGATVSASTSNQGDGGSITVNAPQSVTLGANSQFTVETSGAGKAGDINITTDTLTIGQDAQLSATATRDSTNLEGGGSITLNANQINLAGRLGIFAETQSAAPAGNLTIQSNNNPNLNIRFTDNGFISARTSANGQGGNINIIAPQTLDIRGKGQITVETTGSGDAGNINLTSPNITLANGVTISASTRAGGDAGNITLNGSQITLQQANINAFTDGQGDAGTITVQNADNISLNNSSISTAVTETGTGQGGNINIQTSSITLNNAQITARSQGTGNAGNINLQVNGAFDAIDSDVTTSAERSSGGAITITTQTMRLLADSDIRTNVANGAGGGGNITLTADSILAFDDSDILAFARDGQGGNVTLNTPIFFGEGFQSTPPNTNPDNLDGNGRVDINASGAISGIIILPDLTFIRNSLTELPENILDTDNLIANSCVAPNRRQTGTFIITGSGGLPVRPGDASVSPYPTGTVRTVPSKESSRFWQVGDPIVEPQGVYRLGNGQLVLSRQCQ